MRSERVVTVCDQCLTACCWQGRFLCDKAAYAGTVDKSVAELRELNREHPSYWEPPYVASPLDLGERNGD